MTTTTRDARLPGQRRDPHHRRPHTTTGLLGALNRQCQDLAGRPTRSSNGTPWAAHHPALRGLQTAGEVLQAINADDHVDPLLHALLQLHHDGDDLAGRLVLQTMLGLVRRRAYTAHKRGLADPLEHSLEAMWTAIATYPLHRRHRVAGNLALEALHHLERGQRAERPLEDDQLDAQLAKPGSTTTPPPDDTRAQLLSVLRWARQHQVLTGDEEQLLHRLHLDQDAGTRTMAQHAASMGISPAALRQRHCRATRRLAAAVAERLGHAPSI